MARITFDLPTMYGDHHVVEVRRLLFELPGVTDVYASSGFRIVEIEYDDAAVVPATIEARLSESGYGREMPSPVEVGAAGAGANGNRAFFRHTAAYAQTGRTVGFAQKVPFSGQPLWPCPGMGIIVNSKE